MWKRYILGVVHCLTFQGFSLPHKLYTVQFEVINKVQTYILAPLFRIEVIEGESVTPTLTWGLETLVLTRMGSDAFATLFLYKSSPLFIRA